MYNITRVYSVLKQHCHTKRCKMILFENNITTNVFIGFGCFIRKSAVNKQNDLSRYMFGRYLTTFV